MHSSERIKCESCRQIYMQPQCLFKCSQWNQVGSCFLRRTPSLWVDVVFIAWSHASEIGLDLLPLLTWTYRIMHHSPEHRLMPVGFVSSCHILSCQPSTHDGMIVVLHTSTPQSDVIETCSISSLRGKKKMTCDWPFQPNHLIWRGLCALWLAH